MSTNWFKMSSMIVVAGLAMLTGCSGNSGERAIETPDYAKTAPSETWSGTRTRPAPITPAPAPAPAPVVDSRCMMAFPTGDMATSSLTVKKNLPAEVVAGKAFDYEYVVTNLTNSSLDQVVLSDNLSANFRLNASNPQADAAGGLVKWSLGTLAPRESRTIKASGIASGAGEISSCSNVTYTNSLCCSVKVVQPALKVVHSVTPRDGVTKCDMITYTIAVTNTGTGDATNVKVRSQLPNGVKMQDGRTVFEQNVGTLRGGETRNFTFQAMLPKDGTFTSTAQATADGGLTATSNEDTVIGVQPVLTVTRACPKTAYMTRASDFDIVVTNAGSSRARGVVVEDTIPPGSSFVSATEGGSAQGGKVVWTLADLEPRASKTLRVRYNLLAEHKSNVNTTVTARATCADPATATCVTQVMGAADIGTQISDDNGVVRLDDPHTFTYIARNQGQIDLTNVVMVAEFDPGLEYQSTSWSGGGQAAGQKVTFKIGTIRVGQSVNLTMTVKGVKEGEMIVKSITTGDQVREVRNDEQVNYVPK